MSFSDSNNSLSTSNNAFYKDTGLRSTRRYFNFVSNQLFGDTSDDGDAGEVLFDQLEELLKQTWNIWGVSMLYEFLTDNEVQMKKYAKNLREELAMMLAKENVSYETKFTILNMKRPKQSDHPTVKIEVFAKVIDQNSSKQTNIYTGYLLSWKSENFGRLKDRCTKLPLVLCRGTKNTIKSVHSVLSSCGCESAKNQDELRLEYIVPGLPASEVIRMKFKVKTLHKLWISLLGDKPRIDPETVETFFDILYRQIKEVAGLQLGFCLLHRVSFPHITIAENKMKVSNADVMNTVLTYFNEKALDLLHIGSAHLRAS